MADPASTDNFLTKKSAKIFVAGYQDLVGSTIVQKLQTLGFTSLVLRTHAELDLTVRFVVDALFAAEKPEFVHFGDSLCTNYYTISASHFLCTPSTSVPSLYMSNSLITNLLFCGYGDSEIFRLWRFGDSLWIHSNRFQSFHVSSESFPLMEIRRFMPQLVGFLLVACFAVQLFASDHVRLMQRKTDKFILVIKT